MIVSTATYEAKFSYHVNQQRKELVTSKGDTVTSLEQNYRESKSWDVRKESDALLSPISKREHHHHRKSLWGSSNNNNNSNHSSNNNNNNNVNRSSTTINSIPNNVPELMHDLDAMYRHDDPSHIALPPRLNPLDTEKYLKALQELIKKHTKSDGLQTKDDRQAQVK